MGKVRGRTSRAVDEILRSFAMHSSGFLFEEKSVRTSKRRTQRYSAIMRLLSQSPHPLNSNVICRRLRSFGTLPTVFYAIKELEKGRWICKYAVKTHAQGRSGKSSLYDLTPKGLLKVLAEMDPEKEDNKVYDKLAHKYYELMPGIFSLWPEVVKASIEDDAKLQLKHTVSTCVEELRNDPLLDTDLEILPRDAERLKNEARTKTELERAEWICDSVRHTQDRLTAYFLGTSREELRSHAMFPKWFHRKNIGTVAFGVDFASEYDRWLTRVGANEFLREATVRSLVKELFFDFRKQVNLANTQLESLAEHGIALRLTRAEDIGRVQELVEQISSLRTIVNFISLNLRN